MFMEKQMPLVTVITPAYNRASFLDETVSSVLSQDYPNIEYIVLDDGSTDDTLNVIKKYEGKIRWDTHKNMGETKTVNKGFSMSNGEIIVVVNSDDPLLPGAIRAAVAVMQERPDALVVYPDWNEIGSNSEIIRQMQLPDYNIVNMLTTFNVAMGPGTFIRRKAFSLVGMRDPQFKYAGDLEFWFRLALHGKLVHIPKVLATHRTHPGSASVSERGPKMAGELVSVVRRIYANPNLSPEIRKLRAKVFSIVHYVAASYCSSDIGVAIKHYLASLRYDPLCFFARATVLSLLPIVLRKPVYGGLRSGSQTDGPLWRVRHRLFSWAGLWQENENIE